MGGQTKREVTKAARDMLLGDRIRVIEELADSMTELESARERERAASEDRRVAEEKVREAYSQASTTGWTAKELRTLGFVPPRKPRRDTKSPGSSTTTRADADVADARRTEGENSVDNTVATA